MRGGRPGTDASRIKPQGVPSPRVHTPHAPGPSLPSRYANPDSRELRARGRYWSVSDEPNPLPDPAEHECFANTARAVALKPKWRYAEGLTWILGRWVHHAWAVDEEGRVVECTWPGPGESYYGVAFTREEYQSRAQVPSPSATGRETRTG